MYQYYIVLINYLNKRLSNEHNFERSSNIFNIAGPCNGLNLNRLSNVFLSNSSHIVALLEI